MTSDQRSKFEAAFGLGWYEAMAAKTLVNAKAASREVEALAAAGVAGADFGALWEDAKGRKPGLVKLGGGFYVGKVSSTPAAALRREPCQRLEP